MPSRFSRASITLQAILFFTKYRFSGRRKATRRTHRRVAKGPDFLRCILGFYVCVPFNKFLFTPIITYSRTQWRWRDLNPRPSPCKGAALPLSYIPRTCHGLVGLTGFEPVTPALSAQCSNQLSYKPASLTLTTEE